jgi:hypothetical protein
LHNAAGGLDHSLRPGDSTSNLEDRDQRFLEVTHIQVSRDDRRPERFTVLGAVFFTCPLYRNLTRRQVPATGKCSAVGVLSMHDVQNEDVVFLNVDRVEKPEIAQPVSKNPFQLTLQPFYVRSIVSISAQPGINRFHYSRV